MFWLICSHGATVRSIVLIDTADDEFVRTKLCFLCHFFLPETLNVQNSVYRKHSTQLYLSINSFIFHEQRSGWSVALHLEIDTCNTTLKRGVLSPSKMLRLREQDALIPRPRGTLPKACAVVLTATAIGGNVFLSPEKFFGWVAMVILILTLGPLLHGICLMAEEVLNHSNTRWEKRVWFISSAYCQKYVSLSWKPTVRFALTKA